MPACAVRRAGGAPRKGFSSSSSAGPACGRGTSRVENLFTGFPALSRNSIVTSPCGRFFRKNCTTAPPGGVSPPPAPPPGTPAAETIRVPGMEQFDIFRRLEAIQLVEHAYVVQRPERAAFRANDEFLLALVELHV